MNIVYLLQFVYEQVQYNIFRVSMISNENLSKFQLIESTLFFMQTDSKKRLRLQKHPFAKTQIVST